MIRQIKIKNFALAKNIEIEFKNGFNVLIGETGAGKSIVLKSIYYLLGEKFNKQDIRTGENFVKVVGLFDTTYKANKILEKFGLEKSDEILISRYNDAGSKSEIRVNGEFVTLAMLNELSETLVDSYGQHESTSLLKVTNHIDILDSFKPETLFNYKQQLTILMDKYKELKDELAKFGGDTASRERLLDLLDYQIREIQDVNPIIDEDSEIESKLFTYRNSEKVNEILESIIERLDGNNGIISNLKETSKLFTQLSKFDETAEKNVAKLDNFYFEIKDIAENIEQKLNSSEFSEYELEKLDERLDKIKSLKKKYGGEIADILAFLQKAIIDKDNIVNAEAKLEKLNNEIHNVEVKLDDVSEKLTLQRKAIAVEFEEKLSKEFEELGMKNAKLKVNFAQSKTYSSNGKDSVEFLFSANLGQGFKALSKTISGGEMSRFMLALKNIIAEKEATPTLIFDEIDSGISGEIGSSIAKKIAKISKKDQVICITHLPQVCAMADSFFYVSKSSVDNSTSSNVENIFQNKVEECIAKLSGGKFDTEISIAHAKELLVWADNFKKTL